MGAASSAGSGGKSVGPGSVPGSGGVLPMIVQHDSDDQSATTRSAVAAGTISITDGVSQKQDVAGLSRDTADTNGQVSKLPDVKAMLDRQADTMQAAQAAGQVVTQGIGAYADAKARDALDTAKLAMERGDLDGMAAALSDFESWSEGGNSRAGLHLAGGALIGGLGGGSAFGAVGGAAGAGLSSKLADQTKAAASAVTDATNSSLVGSITGNILSGLAGGLAGGSAGASLGADVNLYNQGNNKNDTEAKSEAAELRKFLEKERAMLGQASAKVPKGTEAQAVTINAPAGALVGGKLVLNDNRATKIFGTRDGHIADSPANRALLTDVANDPATTLGPDKFGTVWSAKNQPDGTQVWVQTRNGEVWNGGVNKTPVPYNPETGLAAPTRPGWKK